jgi:hypothetical protein
MHFSLSDITRIKFTTCCISICSNVLVLIVLKINTKKVAFKFIWHFNFLFVCYFCSSGVCCLETCRMNKGSVRNCILPTQCMYVCMYVFVTSINNDYLPKQY